MRVPGAPYVSVQAGVRQAGPLLRRLLSKPALTCREGIVPARISTCDASHRRLQSTVAPVTSRQKKDPMKRIPTGFNPIYLRRMENINPSGVSSDKREHLKVSEDYADITPHEKCAPRDSVVEMSGNKQG